MVNLEDTPPPRRSSTSTPAKPEYRPSPTKSANVYEIQAPAHDNRRDIRPPQPSPLQTQGQNDFHFRNGSAFPNMQSPYQQTPPPGFSGGHVPPSHILNRSPSHGHQTPQYSKRESYPGSGHPNSRSFGHSTPLSQTPTASTPGSASVHSNFQRPSSSHSITTPISAQHPSSFLRESPQAAHHQVRTSSQSHNGHQYMSQPSTPLGPPLTYTRLSLNIQRGSPGAHDHQRTLSGGSYGQSQATTPSSATARSPQNYKDQHTRSSMQSHTSLREREGSESVSPRTRLPSLPPIDSMETSSDQAHERHGPVTPAKPKMEWTESGPENGVPHQLNRTPSLITSIGVKGLLNAESPDEAIQRAFRQQTTQSPSKYGLESEAKVFGKTPSSQTKPMYQPHLDTNVPSNPPPSTSRDHSTQRSSSLHQTSQPSASFEMMPKPLSQPSETTSQITHAKLGTVHQDVGVPKPHSANDRARTIIPVKRESHQTIKVKSSEDGVSLSSQPARKRPGLGQPASEPMPPAIQKPTVETSIPSNKSSLEPGKKTHRVPRIANWRDIPVYAQSVRGKKRTEDLFLLSQQRAATGQRAPPASQMPQGDPSHLRQVDGNQSAVGHAASPNSVQFPMAEPLADNGPLGPWEPSMLGVEPAEELTKIVMDFLFQEVMSRPDVGVGPAGGAANLGAIFEIEAKIGQLIDQNTNDRLRLPVLNECVISHNSPDLRVKFQSSMTEVRLLCVHSYTLLLTTVPSIGPASHVQPVSEHSSCQLSTSQTRSTSSAESPHPNDLQAHLRNRYLLRAFSGGHAPASSHDSIDNPERQAKQSQGSGYY